jgi:Flp pilus assembly protein TadD
VGPPETYASGLALAVAQIADHDLTSARHTLDGLVARYPTEPGARIQRAIARFGLHDVAGARSDLHRAHHLQPRNPVPGRILAEIKDRLAAQP